MSLSERIVISSLLGVGLIVMLLIAINNYHFERRVELYKQCLEMISTKNTYMRCDAP